MLLRLREDTLCRGHGAPTVTPASAIAIEIAFRAVEVAPTVPTTAHRPAGAQLARLTLAVTLAALRLRRERAAPVRPAAQAAAHRSTGGEHAAQNQQAHDR